MSGIAIGLGISVVSSIFGGIGAGRARREARRKKADGHLEHLYKV